MVYITVICDLETAEQITYDNLGQRKHLRSDEAVMKNVGAWNEGKDEEDDELWWVVLLWITLYLICNTFSRIRFLG